MEFIDCHTHIMPDKTPSFCETFKYKGFIQLLETEKKNERGRKLARMVRDDGKFFREVEENCWDPKRRIEDMFEFGIDHQVLSTIPVLFYYWARGKDALATSQFLNDHMIEILEEHSQYFLGLGTVPLQNIDLACGELERIMKCPGMRGIQIGTHLEKRNLNESYFYPLYELAQRLGAAILVHPWDMMGMNTLKDYWLPWLVAMPAETSRAICSMVMGGVFDKFPRLKVCFAHGGGSFPFHLGRIEHGHKMRPDLCARDNPRSPREYLGRFYIDSITHDPKILSYLIDLLGADKIMLGSDYPFPLGEIHPGRMIREHFKENHSVYNQLMSASAREWLSL